MSRITRKMGLLKMHCFRERTFSNSATAGTSFAMVSSGYDDIEVSSVEVVV